MSARNDGGPAFPYGEVHTRESAAPPYETEVTSRNKPGMSLRQYYAAKAMQAMYVQYAGQYVGGAANNVHLLAEAAFKVADAMIAAEAA